MTQRPTLSIVFRNKRALGAKYHFSKLQSKYPDHSSQLHTVVGDHALRHKSIYVHKLEQKAREGLMIGYEKDSRSYRI